jgi:hypothetical protein
MRFGLHQGVNALRVSGKPEECTTALHSDQEATPGGARALITT